MDEGRGGVTREEIRWMDKAEWKYMREGQGEERSNKKRYETNR